MILRRVDPWSAAKITGAVYAGIGIFLGVIFALMSIVGAGVAQISETQGEFPPLLGALFGVGAIVLVPLLYGALGLISGALVAALYNFCSRYVGGLEVELIGSGPT